jgi:hypothetical protein
VFPLGRASVAPRPSAARVSHSARLGTPSGQFLPRLEAGANLADEEKMSEEGSRLDRELIELLNEVRVILPGLSVIFGFLLTVPFSSGFADLTDSQVNVYFSLLLVTLSALVLFKAPSAFHRIRFRERDKEVLIRWANFCMIAGLVLFGVCFVLAIFLVSSVLFDTKLAWIAAGGSGGLTLILWFLVPLFRKHETDGKNTSGK